MKRALKLSDNLRGSRGVFAVCMGKQCQSVFRHGDIGRAKSFGIILNHPYPASTTLVAAVSGRRPWLSRFKNSIFCFWGDSELIVVCYIVSRGFSAPHREVRSTCEPRKPRFITRQRRHQSCGGRGSLADPR